MKNDSALASRWFWSLCHGKPNDSGRESNGENQTARINLTTHFLVTGKLHEHKTAGQTGLNGVVKP